MRKVIRMILFLPYILILCCLFLSWVEKYQHDFYISMEPLLYQTIGYGALYNICVLIAAFYYRMCPYFKSAIAGLLLMNIIGVINYFYPIIGGIKFMDVTWTNKDIYENTILIVTVFITSFFIIREKLICKI